VVCAAPRHVRAVFADVVSGMMALARFPSAVVLMGSVWWCAETGFRRGTSRELSDAFG
jgi:hypothetical protein